jgi:hypothetical protein
MKLRDRITINMHPRTWVDRGVELAWRALPEQAPTVPLTWPLDRERLRDVVVRWPSTIHSNCRAMIGGQVRDALGKYVRTETAELPQPYDRVINFQIEIAGRSHRVMVETSDYPDLNELAYADADLHFKMEYRKDGYGDRNRLLPGGYVPNDSAIYSYLPRLRKLRDEAPPRYEVSGRYGLSMEKRRVPLEILRSSRRFAFYGGEGKVRYSRYLREVAQSRVCIDLPSMSSVTFRMIDYLAVGTCIVGPPHTNQMQAPFENGVHVAYCKPDYSDLEQVCAYYLENEPARQALITNSRTFFDRYLHRDQLGAYYLHHCLERLR